MTTVPCNRYFFRCRLFLLSIIVLTPNLFTHVNASATNTSANSIVPSKQITDSKRTPQSFINYEKTPTRRPNKCTFSGFRCLPFCPKEEGLTTSINLPVITPVSLEGTIKEVSLKRTINEEEKCNNIRSHDCTLEEIIRQLHSQTENLDFPVFPVNEVKSTEWEIAENERILKETDEFSAIPVYKRLAGSTRKINKIFSNDNNGPSMQQGVSYSVNYSSEKDTRKLRISRAIKMNNPSTPRPSMAPCVGPIVPPHHTFQISKAPSLRSGFSTQDKEEEKDNDIQ